MMNKRDLYSYEKEDSPWHEAYATNSILLQQKIEIPSFNDYIEANILLNELYDSLDKTLSAKTYSAKTVLHNFLHFGFDSLGVWKNLISGGNFDIAQYDSSIKPGPVETKYINMFLLRLKEKNFISSPLQRVDSVKHGRTATPRYYVSEAQLMSVLMLFIYYDGRDFNSTENYNRLPRLNLNKCKSIESYNAVLNRISEIYSSNSGSTKYIPRKLHTYISCNRALHFHALNSLNYYMSSYDNSNFLTHVFQICRNINYDEVISLHQKIVDSITSDNDFLYCIINSTNLDPLYFYDMYLQFHASVTTYMKYDDLNSLLNSAKEYTKRLASLDKYPIEIIETVKDKISRYMGKNTMLDRCEAIYEVLSSNSYFKQWSSHLLETTNSHFQYLKFDTFKNYINL